jgi:bacterioferritin-associated ferredoxin
MYVCICHGVTDNEINAEIATGARTEEEIGERCGAGTGCGTCVDKICALLGARHRDRGKIAAEMVI